MRKLWALKVKGVQMEEKIKSYFVNKKVFFVQLWLVFIFFQFQNKHLGKDNYTYEPFQPSM